MQDPIDKANLLGYAYKALQKTEGWTYEMLEQFKQIVIAAEEEEVNYIASQDYLLHQEAKAAETMIKNKQIANYYKDKGTDNA